jgi:hypothetical protein
MFTNELLQCENLQLHGESFTQTVGNSSRHDLKEKNLPQRYAVNYLSIKLASNSHSDHHKYWHQIHIVVITVNTVS